MTNKAIDLFAAFAVDEAAEENGIMTPIPGAGDTMFKVARAGNKTYNRLFQKLLKQNKVVLDSKGEAADKKAEEIFIEVMVKSILLGWEGTVLFKGEALEYSRDNAKKLLSHKEFRAAVTKVSEDMEQFKVVKDEEDEKN